VKEVPTNFPSSNYYWDYGSSYWYYEPGYWDYGSDYWYYGSGGWDY
jgi:hypothetical protein